MNRMIIWIMKRKMIRMYNKMKMKMKMRTRKKKKKL